MKPKIYLIGTGMGNSETLTLAGKQAIDHCDLLIGAPRLLALYQDKACKKMPAVSPAEIFAAILAHDEERQIGVLFSGDVGFYSGAKGLHPYLEGYDTETLCGVSSLSYFCARLGQPWQEVHTVSGHGRPCNAAGAIQSHGRTFLLTGGKYKAESICQALCSRGLGHVRIWTGENLSYPEERILSGTALELAEEKFSDLTVMLAENPRPVSLGAAAAAAAVSLPDDVFCRGKVPMTKEAVRTLSLARLKLGPEAILWDVGAGSGSISVTAALVVQGGQVFAVEKEVAALEVIAANKEKFGTTNLSIVAGTAPEVLLSLPAPDAVFIGGSGGRLREIIVAALEKNRGVRIVINAITLESLSQALECLKEFGLTNTGITQISVAEAKAAGTVHMMLGQNPVYIISGEGQHA